MPSGMNQLLKIPSGKSHLLQMSTGMSSLGTLSLTMRMMKRMSMVKMQDRGSLIAWLKGGGTILTLIMLTAKYHINLLFAPKGNERLCSKCDLIANFVHDGRPGEGSYKVFVQQKSE
ncbi:unnamed protein product [Ilex paraguariensis]|uniref:Uncharacterized protein n=1 Tax=Ilex paraguariensis TaxID=185542 RepID=A0ABC8U515_9AQUA